MESRFQELERRLAHKFDPEVLPHRKRLANNVVRPTRARVELARARSSPMRRGGGGRRVNSRSASERFVAAAPSERVVQNSALGVSVTFGPGTLPAGVAVYISEVPPAARPPLPEGGVRIPTWKKVIHDKQIIRADGSVKTVKGVGKASWEKVTEASLGALWRDVGPCVEITPHAHEEAGAPFENLALVRFKHSSAQCQSVFVLHASARALEAGEGWELLPTEFKYGNSILARTHVLGYFRVVQPQGAREVARLSVFRRCLLGGAPGGLERISVWLHACRPDVTRRVHALEAAAVRREDAGEEEGGASLAAVDADPPTPARALIRTNWTDSFAPMLPEKPEPTEMEVGWSERVRVELGQDFEHAQGVIRPGQTVRARPRALDKNGQRVSTIWQQGWEDASVRSVEGLSDPPKPKEDDPRYTLLFADGHVERDVPRLVMQQKAGERQIKRMQDFSGGNSAVVRWRGEPVRVVLMMDIPRAWPQLVYPERVWLSCTERQPTGHYTQDIHLPMDSVQTATGVQPAELVRRSQRGEHEADVERSVDAGDGAAAAAMASEFTVPASVRFRTGDINALRTLHRALVTRKSQRNGCGGGLGDTAPAESAEDMAMQASAAKFRAEAEREAEREAAQEAARREAALGRVPYCHLCARRVRCHHIIAKDLKRARRERVYGCLDGIGGAFGGSAEAAVAAGGRRKSMSKAIIGRGNPCAGWLNL
eukprot:g2547.t1